MLERCIRAAMLWLCVGGIVGAPRVYAAQADFRETFKVDKAALADKGSNRYMILTPGYKQTFMDGKDTLTITVLDETKIVDGVKTRIVEERETKGGKLAEVSRNYFAIDRVTADIYYFGEDVDMYDAGGQVTDHEGSWLSGVKNARFGLLMPGEPKIGERYYQEMAPKLAMDRAEVVSVTEKVRVPVGVFENCLKTRESSALERGTEAKFYAPGVGLLKDGGFKLTRIETPGLEGKLPDAVAKTFKTMFPLGAIDKLDVEEENGVVVYDIEFTEGSIEKETDITADGTMLEFTIVVGVENVPAAAMKAIRAAAGAAALGRIEHIVIGYEITDGKTVRLAEPVVHYAVELATADGSTEVVVDADGNLIEEAP